MGTKRSHGDADRAQVVMELIGEAHPCQQFVSTSAGLGINYDFPV